MVVTESAVLLDPEQVELTFEQVFHQHYPKVYGLLYRVTGSAQDADDLAQEVFLQLYRRQPPIWQDPAAEGWLWRAANHAALNALRGHRRRRVREEQAFEKERPVRMIAERLDDPAERLARQAEQDGVREALRRLNPRESSLLLLRHAGLSYAAMA